MFDFNKEIEHQGISAKEINCIARRRGLITEVNTDQGFIELLDNELRQIAIAERIFI